MILGKVLVYIEKVLDDGRSGVQEVGFIPDSFIKYLMKKEHPQEHLERIRYDFSREPYGFSTRHCNFVEKKGKKEKFMISQPFPGNAISSSDFYCYIVINGLLCVEYLNGYGTGNLNDYRSYNSYYNHLKLKYI